MTLWDRLTTALSSVNISASLCAIDIDVSHDYGVRDNALISDDDNDDDDDESIKLMFARYKADRYAQPINKAKQN